MNRKVGTALMIVLVIFCLGLGSWNVLHGDLVVNSDIARDFLLLDELSHKLILSGPRASGMDGVFHGPLWLYLNYPAYFLGKGNPIIIGWFWVLLSALNLFFNFQIVKRIFNKKAAAIFSILFAVQLIDSMNSLYNPYGAMFLMPLFFYWVLKYIKTISVRYLLGHLFVCGLIIQFQMAMGVPLLLLAAGLDIYLIIRNKKYSQLFSFLILSVPLSTFILFDLRHQFNQTQAVINYIVGKGKYGGMDIASSLSHRLHIATIVGLGFFKEKFEMFNIIPSYVMVLMLFRAAKDKRKEKHLPFLLFIYFYIGFYVLTLLHNGWVLSHYWLPMTVLVFMIFAGLSDLTKSKLYYVLLGGIITINLFSSVSKIQSDALSFSGKDENSWKFQLNFVTALFNTAPDKFGLYIYSPDILGYQAKNALVYGQRLNPAKQAFINQKKSVTFVVTTTPPQDKPHMNGDWWIINKVKINKKPEEIINFPNGYRIIKYSLTQKEVNIPSDSALNDWLFYR